MLPKDMLTLNTVYNIYFTKPTKYKLEFVLGVVLSSCLAWYWRRAHSDQKRTFPKIKKAALLAIPLPRLDLSSPAGLKAQGDVCDQVEELLRCVAKLGAPRSPHQQDQLDRRIQRAEAELNSLIADLYGFSAAERDAIFAQEKTDRES
jgi:hypothetical protein